MRTAEEILKDCGHWGKTELMIKAINEARIEAIKECAEDLQKLRNQYEVINGNYVVSVYPIDELIESFENKIDQVK